MGEVYEVHDLELHSRVALKVISLKSAAKPNSAEMFRREILLARQVTHPNVCRIYDIGHHEHADHGDLLFLTMEFLEGTTLADHVRTQGPLSKEEALPLIRQMIHALAAAHRLNIAHRDFKSGNVILCEAQGASGSDRSEHHPRARLVADSLRSFEPTSGSSAGPAPAIQDRVTKSAQPRAPAQQDLTRHQSGAAPSSFGRAAPTRDRQGHRLWSGAQRRRNGDHLPRRSLGHAGLHGAGTVPWSVEHRQRHLRPWASSSTRCSPPSCLIAAAPAPASRTAGPAPPWREFPPSGARRQEVHGLRPADRYATVEEVWAALQWRPDTTARPKTIFGISHAVRGRGTGRSRRCRSALAPGWSATPFAAGFNPVPEQKHIAVLQFENLGDRHC